MELRGRLRRGELRAVEVAMACLERVSRSDGNIGAWERVDRDLVLTQAKAADERRQNGRPLGPLHGIPVGVKDIIDTADLPTENGASMDAGRRPTQDATVAARLRAAGAVILGKTVTTECAYMAPGKTRNPHDLERTPGGSSSGSAAAVASTMVPVAVGTQTGGSVIRPASYCGVVGFKPSFGLIPRTGILSQSPWLDTVGTFARSVEDAALLADTIAGYDPSDTDTHPAAPPNLLGITLTDPPVTPALAFVKTPAWKEIEDDCAQGFSELVEALEEHCDAVELPPIYEEAAFAQWRLQHVGMARHLRHYAERGRDTLARQTREGIAAGGTISAVDFLSALEWRDVLRSGLDEVFTRYDAIVTPAASGEAPLGLTSTGSPAFCVLWTLTGLPTVSLPVLEGHNRMPIGVQLVGQSGQDGRLMRTARWLTQKLQGET